MQTVIIHESGSGRDKFRVLSYGNGFAYNFEFGEAGSPIYNIFLQGDDAIDVCNMFDSLEKNEPETDSRNLWMRVIDPYLA